MFILDDSCAPVTTWHLADRIEGSSCGCGGNSKHCLAAIRPEQVCEELQRRMALAA